MSTSYVQTMHDKYYDFYHNMCSISNFFDPDHQYNKESGNYRVITDLLGLRMIVLNNLLFDHSMAILDNTNMDNYPFMRAGYLGYDVTFEADYKNTKESIITMNISERVDLFAVAAAGSGTDNKKLYEKYLIDSDIIYKAKPREQMNIIIDDLINFMIRYNLEKITFDQKRMKAYYDDTFKDVCDKMKNEKDMVKLKMIEKMYKKQIGYIPFSILCKHVYVSEANKKLTILQLKYSYKRKEIEKSKKIVKTT